MIVMPANASGWFWHSLARETGRIGHLYSPDAQRGPWPWLPYAFDNGAFSCWNPIDNSFNESKWKTTEKAWIKMMEWAFYRTQKARWAIVPDRPGNAAETFQKWPLYAGIVKEAGIPLAMAVQDGMTVDDVQFMEIAPDVICVGGSTDWKWKTAEMWIRSFPRVHVLRCNAPDKLQWLEDLGAESCDGTGWNRGDRKQTQGVEEWARRSASKDTHLQPIYPLWPHVCRGAVRQSKESGKYGTQIELPFI